MCEHFTILLHYHANPLTYTL